MFSMREVSDRLRQRPFVPLRLVTSSGEAYDVKHPDLVLVGQREVAIGIGTPEEPRNYVRLARVSILHITAMEDLPTSPAEQSDDGEGNGRQ